MCPAFYLYVSWDLESTRTNGMRMVVLMMITYTRGGQA